MAAESLRVFVSSTFSGMQADRTAVRDVIDELSKRGLPCIWVGMEDFGSLPTSPLQASREFVEHSDVVILLIGDSYGSTPPDGLLSFTHEEFEVVRRYKIPCLAYMLEVDRNTLAQPILNFRDVVTETLTVAKPYRTPDQLKAQVRHDLELLVEGYLAAGDIHPLDTKSIAVEPPQLVGRDEELSQLLDWISGRPSPICVWGPSGIGKTALMHHFFSTRTSKLVSPIWLRVDELFGRDPSGRLLVHSTRRRRIDVLDETLRLGASPRAVIVFDNVQAAPLEVAWIFERLRDRAAAFLSWDLHSLPESGRIMHLRSLRREESHALLASYARPEQLGDESTVARVCDLLEHHPLFLSFEGRRLRSRSHLTVSDLELELLKARGRLDREGRHNQTELTTRSVLLTTFEALPKTERLALGGLAHLPAVGISEPSMAWALSSAGHGLGKPHRAIELGLLEARTCADWRGVRYRIRSLVGDFLRSTDAFRSASADFAAFANAESTLLDPCPDVAILPLQHQLFNSPNQLPFEGRWIEGLLVNATPLIRHRVSVWTTAIVDPLVREALAHRMGTALRKLHSEDGTLEFLSILGSLRCNTSDPTLKSLLMRPNIKSDWYHTIAYAAAEALAKVRGTTASDLLKQMIDAGSGAEKKAALFAVSSEPLLDCLPAVRRALADSDPAVREEAASTLSAFPPDPQATEALRALWKAADSSRDSEEALLTLGVWADQQVLPDLLRRLTSDDPNVVAETLSVLLRFDNPDVPDRIYNAAIRWKETNIQAMAAHALLKQRDERAADLLLPVLRSGDPGASLYFSCAFCGEIATDLPSVSGACKQDLIRSLLGLLDSEDFCSRVTARAALLAWRCQSGSNGLWDDLRHVPTRSDLEASYRHLPLLYLSDWQPANFDSSKLQPLLADPDVTVRARAAQVAGKVNAIELTDDLLLLTVDDSRSPALGNKTVAAFAKEALDDFFRKAAEVPRVS